MQITSRILAVEQQADAIETKIENLEEVVTTVFQISSALELNVKGMEKVIPEMMRYDTERIAALEKQIAKLAGILREHIGDSFIRDDRIHSRCVESPKIKIVTGWYSTRRGDKSCFFENAIIGDYPLCGRQPLRYNFLGADINFPERPHCQTCEVAKDRKPKTIDGWRNTGTGEFTSSMKRQHYFENAKEINGYFEAVCKVRYSPSWVGDGAEDEQFARCLACTVETFKNNANEAAKGIVEALRPTIDAIAKAWESIPEEVRESLLDDLGMEETPAPWTCDYAVTLGSVYEFECPCGAVNRRATYEIDGIIIECHACRRKSPEMKLLKIRSYPPLVIFTYMVMEANRELP